MSENLWSRRLIGTTATVLLIAIVGLFTVSGPMMLRHAEPPRSTAGDGLDARLTPSTFLVEARRAFRVKATRDFDPSCARVSAAVPEFGFSQDFTRKELLDGVESSLNPARVGRYTMTFTCGDRVIGTAPLSVVMGQELAGGGRAVRWVLSVGTVIYREGASFLLPVMISAEEQRRTQWVPTVVGQSTRFVLRDRNGQLDAKPEPELVLDRLAAISAPVHIPFRIGAGHVLIAQHRGTGALSNEVRVDWKTNGPKLALEASNIEIYAALISSARGTLYLTKDGYLIAPSTPFDVSSRHPPSLTLQPPNTLRLTTSEPIAEYTVTGGTAPGVARVDFTQPNTGLTKGIDVIIRSTWPFQLWATGAGLVGVIVARGAALFRRKPLAIAIELLIAAAAAFLLYGAVLQGWMTALGLTAFTLSTLAAICIGLIGGYVGLGVFTAAAVLFKLNVGAPNRKKPTAPERQPPDVNKKP